VTELVIIGPCPTTDSSAKYLDKLRVDFNLPIYYRYFNLDDSTLAKKE
jgi:hypothetical protein